MKYLLLITIIIANICYAQIPNKFNAVVYTKDIKHGRVILFEASNFIYKTKLEADTLYINDGQFSFSGSTTKPELYYMQIQTDSMIYSTQRFFIDTGTYTIQILYKENSLDLLGGGCKVIIENSLTNDIFFKKYLHIYNDLNSMILTKNELFDKCNFLSSSYSEECKQFCDKLQQQLRHIRDSVFFKYSLSNPNSPIIEYELFLFIRKFGYKEIYEKILRNISKSEYISDDNKAYLKDYLTKKKINKSTRAFPLLHYIYANSSKDTFKKNKFILVEFWFSTCKPCLANFIELQKTYNLFNEKGFEIIAISVDNKYSLRKYKALIKKYNRWINILDIDGKSSAPLDISFYPYNFLLDAKGNILMENISSTQLNYLLNEKLFSIY